MAECPKCGAEIPRGAIQCSACDAGPYEWQPEELTAEEVLRRYKAGERSFINVDIADGSVFYKADLEGAIFVGSFFSSMDARFANLRAVSFRNANVKCTDFRGADLRCAIFDGSSLESTAFKGANVEEVDFSKATAYGSDLGSIRPDDWDFEHAPVDRPPKSG